MSSLRLGLKEARGCPSTIDCRGIGGKPKVGWLCAPAEVLKMLHTFGRREGETDQEHRARLDHQNAEFIAELDRQEEDER